MHTYTHCHVEYTGNNGIICFQHGIKMVVDRVYFIAQEDSSFLVPPDFDLFREHNRNKN